MTAEKKETPENKETKDNSGAIFALGLDETVPFPGIPFILEITNPMQVKTVEHIAAADSFIFTALKIADDEIPIVKTERLNKFGAVTKIQTVIPLSNGSVRAIFTPICRATANKFGYSANGELMAEVALVRDIAANPEKREVQELRELVCNAYKRSKRLIRILTAEAEKDLRTTDDISRFTDIIASCTLPEAEKRQEILEIADVEKRLDRLAEMINEVAAEDAMENELERNVSHALEMNQKEYYLREKIKAIKEELGEGEDSDEYLDAIEGRNLPDYVREKLTKEAERLSQCSFGSPENALLRAYLDTCLEIPWEFSSNANIDVKEARGILEADHYGIEKVKTRILEYIAVQKMTDKLASQIICLVGPPGVGKTSIAASVARAMDREFVRISLGGIKDEADIRGHRKTYIGAMPGRITEALISAGVNNPVILLDEIDKVGQSYNGDPSSALLEVLDPEQNKNFRDHYTELAFDLSNTVFIATANSLDTVARPLVDRMEIIELNTYTRHEKLEIAKRHLLPKQLEIHGLTKKMLSITDGALFELIDYYTAESGVRSLERKISALCRKAALKFAEGNEGKITIKASDVKAYLGCRLSNPEKISNENEVGIVNGLAYTEIGGDLLKIEALVMDGDGKLELTGSLGDVMKESAHAALSYVRSKADELGVNSEFFKKHDIHIHVPEGAVPKDGPSAGVTIATALASIVTRRAVKRDIAMTGELTLTGKVLPIGGLREKTLAAYSAGVKTVFIPRENLAHLDEIDQKVRDTLEFIPVKNVGEIFEQALV